jgi:hypothetical protein
VRAGGIDRIDQRCSIAEFGAALGDAATTPHDSRAAAVPGMSGAR